MIVLYTMLGVILILGTLRDIFQELFRPSGWGALSRMHLQQLWRFFRWIANYDKSILVLAGPSMLISVIGLWIVLLATGWALIMWPHLPEDFLLSPGLRPSNQGDFLDVLYLSLVTLTTLGYGDIAPLDGWLRIFVPLEALIGFGLLTASLTWVLSLYPVLARRRSLAHQLSLIDQTEVEPGETVEDEEAAQTLESLVAQLVTVEGDLNRFPVTYYFHEDNERTALPAAMPKLLRLAEKGVLTDRPAVRRRAAMLWGAVEDFSITLMARGFVNLSPTDAPEVLKAYARDHFYVPKGFHDSDQD